MAEDPFEDVLNLEEQLYQEGYQQGFGDGAHAGRMEGRALGFEKGFEKFLESGRLYGKAIVWAHRLPRGPEPTSPGTSVTASTDAMGGPGGGGQDAEDPLHGEVVSGARQQQQQLPPLPDNARLRKHITSLYALVETESLSTENTDEAVDEFDDRLRRAQGKARVIEKTTGEDKHGDGAQRRHA